MFKKGGNDELSREVMGLDWRRDILKSTFIIGKLIVIFHLDIFAWVDV